ncbi:uncharacterized protein LOC129003716 [Macrosteles quadrilineatus]|uniref:uncharacterized protein LOC129003716 n=1 Tax=Macrosteles quadrilineatus TaxID=74068 RepID=UPI0023E0C2EE|nr:uncharacterized protein LOC129003716 [Macrosteles quadrilineatus]
MAEEKVILCIQKNSFGEKSKFQKNLPVFFDDKGLLRVKTRLVLNDDSEDFKLPILLPSGHPIVTRIIMELHVANQHAGLQSMLVIVRDRFWILKGRKTIRNVLSHCAKCKRFKSKAGEAPVAPLPLERITECNAFQSTGIDLAGPLYLRNGERAWVVLFTCAVYRAVHLELVQSLSTESFISALRRFISRRGRISLIYTDNGTNFVGTNNILKRLDWKTISRKFEIQQITWKFNPPSAPWWGGMWERLVRMVKELLRRNLRLAKVDYEELMTLLCDLESTINSRPLTYMSDDYDTLQPLTPSVFLQPIVKSDVHDLDIVDSTTLNKRVRYLQSLRQNLRSRFKKEYLAMLVHRSKENSGKGRKTISTGDIVLIGDDNIKRINWPLALVLETIRGKDGVCRVAKLKTAKGELTRPIQRLYPMEINSKDMSRKQDAHIEVEDKSSTPTETRRGRKIKIPRKMDL